MIKKCNHLKFVSVKVAAEDRAGSLGANVGLLVEGKSHQWWNHSMSKPNFEELCKS